MELTSKLSFKQLFIEAWSSISSMLMNSKEEEESMTHQLLIQELLPGPAFFGLHSIAEVQSVSFENLWYLFKPGEVIIERPDCPTDHGYSQQAYQVSHMEGGCTQHQSLRIHCFCIGFNGSVFNMRKKTIIIPPFAGSKSPRDLEAFPANCAWAPSVKSRRLYSDLIERGKLFLSNCYGLGRYDGRDTIDRSDYLDGDLFVDFAAALSEDPVLANRFVDPGTWNSITTWSVVAHSNPRVLDYRDLDINCAKEADRRNVLIPWEALKLDRRFDIASSIKITGEMLMQHDLFALLPPALPAFSLTTKQWRKFLILKDLVSLTAFDCVFNRHHSS